MLNKELNYLCTDCRFQHYLPAKLRVEFCRKSVEFQDFLIMINKKGAYFLHKHYYSLVPLELSPPAELPAGFGVALPPLPFFRFLRFQRNF